MSLRLVLACLLLTVLSGMAGATYSAFSATTSNADNTFTAATSFTSCTTSTQSVVASADSFVRPFEFNGQDKSSTNYGTLAAMHVRASSQPDKYGYTRTLVRFSLPSIPAGCRVTAASLVLAGFNDNETGDNGTNSDVLAESPYPLTTGRTIQAYTAGADWTETGVTWNNQPALSGTPVTRTSVLGDNSWNVLTHVEAMYAGSNFGWILKDSSESGSTNGNQGENQYYYSRETTTQIASRPRLELTFGP